MTRDVYTRSLHNAITTPGCSHGLTLLNVAVSSLSKLMPNIASVNASNSFRAKCLRHIPQAIQEFLWAICHKVSTSAKWKTCSADSDVSPTCG